MDPLQQAVDFLLAKSPHRPATAVVLGSGLSGVAERLEEVVEVPYKEIPHFPVSGVAGHGSALVLGFHQGAGLAVLKGRVHAYEGYPLSQVVFPVRVLARLGVETFILTNAAGAINETMAPGDLMVLTDHLNLLGANPLTGPNLDELGPRFPDMTEVYDKALRERALETAKRLGVTLRAGVYAAMSGPSYETPAEIRMLRTLGADAVGMSTVPEAIAARHAGARVLAFSMISNLAAGLSEAPLSHVEVLETGARASKTLASLIWEVL